jgi:hypothetical protein
VQHSAQERGSDSGAAWQAGSCVQQQATAACEKSRVSRQKKQLASLTERMAIRKRSYICRHRLAKRFRDISGSGNGRVAPLENAALQAPFGRSRLGSDFVKGSLRTLIDPRFSKQQVGRLQNLALEPGRIIRVILQKSADLLGGLP